MEFRPVPKPSHKRKVRKRGERSKFSKMVRDQIKEHFNNECQMCFKRGIHVHHVMERSQSGRGVFTNGILFCNSCHKKVHEDMKLLRHWKQVYRKKYGPRYFMDKEDLEMKYLSQDLKEHAKEVQRWKMHNTNPY